MFDQAVTGFKLVMVHCDYGGVIIVPCTAGSGVQLVNTFSRSANHVRKRY